MDGLYYGLRMFFSPRFLGKQEFPSPAVHHRKTPRAKEESKLAEQGALPIAKLSWFYHRA